MTTYTEINAILQRRASARSFDFALDSERAAMGELLYEINELERPNCEDHMISAIVVYLNENDAGSGFYGLAEEYGVLRKGSTRAERDAFWANEVAEVHRLYRRRRRP